MAECLHEWRMIEGREGVETSKCSLCGAVRKCKHEWRSLGMVNGLQHEECSRCGDQKAGDPEEKAKYEAMGAEAYTIEAMREAEADYQEQEVELRTRRALTSQQALVAQAPPRKPHRCKREILFECGRCRAPVLREQIERRPCGHNTDAVLTYLSATAFGVGGSSGG